MNTNKVNRIKIQNVILERITDVRYPGLSGWEVFNADRTIRIGYIYQFKTSFIMKQVSWLKFKEKFWFFERFHGTVIGVGRTRREVIEHLKGNVKAFEIRLG